MVQIFEEQMQCFERFEGSFKVSRLLVEGKDAIPI